MNLIRQHIKKYYDIDEPRMITTPTILCGMYRLDICHDELLLKELALCTKATATDNFRYIYLFEDGDTPIDHKGSVSDLISKIIDPEIARILY